MKTPRRKTSGSGHLKVEIPKPVQVQSLKWADYSHEPLNRRVGSGSFTNLDETLSGLERDVAIWAAREHDKYSIITDLFEGQFMTTACNKYETVSTFLHIPHFKIIKY